MMITTYYKATDIATLHVSIITVKQ